MLTFRGKGVCCGTAVGKAFLFRRRRAEITRMNIADTEAEKARAKHARERSSEQLTEIYEKTLKEAGEESARIFSIHAMMAEDEDLAGEIEKIIDEEKVNAEYAVAAASEKFSDMFASMDDEYMRERASDIKDISDRIIANLTIGASSEKFGGRAIICADDLSPSETASLDRENVLAFVTARGSSNSHTAILARSMDIPAVIGAGEEFLGSISDGVKIAVDGFTGEVFTEPDEDVIDRIKEKQSAYENERELLSELKGKESVTLDGKKINIFANADGPDGAAAALGNGAGGIGLFRSEFIYLESSAPPEEERQFAVYKKILEDMAGKKVIIRTLDIGADKKADYFGLEKEENPALGMRGIRLCLSRPEIFKVQLRALYRASVYGNLGIMFPMIASVSDIEKALAVCDEVKAELKIENIPYSENIEIGIMIETPAAAMISDILAPLVDFFSIGTNDLTQYTLACDRQDPRLESFCDTHSEAVLRLIEMSVKNAHRFGKWAGICGELAADISLTERFLRMGTDELSVSPAFILRVKNKVRNTDLSDMKMRDRSFLL